MRFARFVFISAGIWGIFVLMPLFFLFDITGRRYAPPEQYSQFFYGFISVAMAWQVAFLVIGTNPARFRPMMIPGIIEKLGYVLILAILRNQGRISAADAQAAWPDLVLGVFFIAAFVRLPRRSPRAATSFERAGST